MHRKFAESSLSSSEPMKMRFTTVNAKRGFASQPFSCCSCKRTFASKIDLNRHKLTHTPEQLFYCPYCPLFFTIEETYKSHKQEHEPGTMRSPVSAIYIYKCHLCNVNFSSRSHCLKHFQMQHVDEYAKLISTEALDNDAIIQDTCQDKAKSRTPKLVCAFCNQRLCSPRYLKRHMRSHKDNRPYECQFCQKLFRELGGLKNHIKRVHQIVTQSLASQKTPIIISTTAFTIMSRSATPEFEIDFDKKKEKELATEAKIRGILKLDGLQRLRNRVSKMARVRLNKIFSSPNNN